MMVRLRALACAAVCALAGTAAAAAEWVDYTPQVFAAARHSGETMLVHVTADWCPTCRAQKPILDELSTEESLEDVRFIRVNFDDHKEFLREHNVPRQSTILIFDGEDEIGRSVAETDRDRLRSFVLDTIGR